MSRTELLYLNELAADFHSLWNLGKEEKSLKFIQADKNATLDRLAMIQPLLLRLRSGLDILGVKPEEEMR